MATTDARPGFKLPWSADRNESDSTDAEQTPPAPVFDAAIDAPADSTIAELDAQTALGDPVVEVGDAPIAAVEPAPEPAPEPTTAGPASLDPWRLTSMPVPAEAPTRRKPNKLMADLTRAMQSAAESARDETMARLESEAKAFVESIHTRSAVEADELRQTADADIAGIREWSKAEIARIREETDERIAGRKSTLEREIEAHAARLEGRIERVQAHVAWFDTEMAGFFERLLAEDDPTRLAAMAENLPEPPSFEEDLLDLPEAAVPARAIEAPVETAIETVAGPTELIGTADAGSVDSAAETQSEADTATEPTLDPEAAFAAIQAAAEAAETTAPTLETDELPAASVTDEVASTDDVVAADDPRLAVLGLSSEAAAEAEAEAEVDPTEDVEEIATFSDDALAARLAGLVPREGDAPLADLHSTRVVVTGLISVASIASFKRHLGRLEGVTSVGVSSGPDGEFVFAVMHAPELDLRGTIPTLPGFAAQVTNSTDDTVSVAARDPESES